MAPQATTQLQGNPMELPPEVIRAIAAEIESLFHAYHATVKVTVNVTPEAPTNGTDNSR